MIIYTTTVIVDPIGKMTMVKYQFQRHASHSPFTHTIVLKIFNSILIRCTHVAAAAKRAITVSIIVMPISWLYIM